MNAAYYYTNNFQKLSGIGISEQAFEQVRGMVADKSQNKIAQMLIGTPTPRKQYIAAAALVCIAIEVAGQPRAVDLAGDIIGSQARRIRQYGEKAHPMSERQIKAIVNQIYPYLS